MSNRSQKVVFTPQMVVLKKLRLKRGLSMRAVGQLVGWSDSYISQIENGRENAPRGERLIRLLGVYGIKPKYFDQLVKELGTELSDRDVLLGLVRKLNDSQCKTQRALAEQMARREV